MKVSSSLRSRARVIAWALLPALLLRAVTPVGFMPMHDAHGDLYLAFCPGIGDAMPLPAADDPHREHHGMHSAGMHDHEAASDALPGDKPAPQHHSLCPYALSAGPALAYSAPDLSAPPPRRVAAPAPDYRTLSLPTIERAQSARAPPAPRIA